MGNQQIRILDDKESKQARLRRATSRLRNDAVEVSAWAAISVSPSGMTFPLTLVSWDDASAEVTTSFREEEGGQGGEEEEEGVGRGAGRQSAWWPPERGTLPRATLADLNLISRKRRCTRTRSLLKRAVDFFFSRGDSAGM